MSYEMNVLRVATQSPNIRTYDHLPGKSTLLKEGIKSKCNVCGEIAYANAWRSEETPPRVFLEKHCPAHGITSSPISSDADFYYVPKEGQACGCGPEGCKPSALGENAVTTSQLHTCTLVVEIVEDCNLSCPTCFADSPLRKHGTAGKNLSLADFKERILGVLAKQEKIDILQLSGGEPTLHPQLFELIAWAGNQPGISQILLNTNGTRLAREEYARQLSLIIPKGRFGVYLQYDGLEESGQRTLRGGDFRKVREKALALCEKYALRVALVMTVTHDNKFACASALNRALAQETASWVVFQPEFLSGRNDESKFLEVPINVADIIHSVARGSIMDTGCWIPLPCSDPNCGTVGFLVRQGGQWYPVSKFVDMSKFSPLIANRVNYNFADSLANCGCDEFNLASYLKEYGLTPGDIKMVFIKPFMDRRTWDEARIASCCTHVLTPAGEVQSFCQYYGSR